MLRVPFRLLLLTGLAVATAGCGSNNFDSSAGDPFGDLGDQQEMDAAVEADLQAQEAAMNNN